jgi:YhcH/YjgK/YiaL family protein
MIADNIKNCGRYANLGTKFEKSFAFIKKACEEALPIGRYDIEDDGELYASVQEYTTKAPEDAMFEGHRKYIDVQYVISGIERHEVVDISKVSEKAPYDESCDVQFFENSNKAASLILEAGEYAIFYPEDIHKPGMRFEQPVSVKKIVVKVKI